MPFKIETEHDFADAVGNLGFSCGFAFEEAFTYHLRVADRTVRVYPATKAVDFSWEKEYAYAKKLCDTLK